MAAAHCRGTLQTFSYPVGFKSSENSRKKMKRKSLESQAQTLKIGVSYVTYIGYDNDKYNKITTP